MPHRFQSTFLTFCCSFTSHRGGVVEATRRHANVLCACAIVTAIPYTSPSQRWFADLIFKLCRLSDEGGQVGQSVFTLLCSFHLHLRMLSSQLLIFTLPVRCVPQLANTGRCTMTRGMTCAFSLQRKCGNQSIAAQQATLTLHDDSVSPPNIVKFGQPRHQLRDKDESFNRTSCRFRLLDNEGGARG